MMTDPLVTVGVPVYRGQEALPALLECLRTQSYSHLDVHISVDAGDLASADACRPILRHDSRFRMNVQSSRLGWAGNTDWTMRNRRGDFYIYQQHDDLVSPTYVADLVEASVQWPSSVICFSRIKYTGRHEGENSAPSLLGNPLARVLRYLRRLDWVPFRGLIRGSALDRTSGLILSDFDPFDSYGTEIRFMAELALIGEFRLVEGPKYFKSLHDESLHSKRLGWSREHKITSMACFAAWMIEVVAPAGRSARERGDLFRFTLDRFARGEDLLDWFASVSNWLRRSQSKAAIPVQKFRDQLARSDHLASLNGDITGKVAGDGTLPAISAEDRPLLLRQVVERLKNGGRFDPRQCLDLTWAELEQIVTRDDPHARRP